MKKFILITAIVFSLLLTFKSSAVYAKCNCPGSDCDHCGCTENITWGRRDGCATEGTGSVCGECNIGAPPPVEENLVPCCFNGQPRCGKTVEMCYAGQCYPEFQCWSDWGQCGNTNPCCTVSSWSQWLPVCTAQNCSNGFTQTRTNNCGGTETKQCSCAITYTPTPPLSSPTPTPTVGLGTPTPTSGIPVTPTGPLTPTPTPATGAFISWFKTKLGNVHSNNDIVVSIPSLLEKFATYLVTANSLSSFAAGTGYDARPDLASEKNWYWYSPPYGVINFPETSGFYEYYRIHKMPSKTVSLNQLSNAAVASLAGDGKNIPVVAVDATGGSLNTTDDITLSGNKQLVLYINGDFNIRNNIKFSGESGIIFVVKGDLNISNSPEETDGIYLVDKTVNTAESDSNVPLTVKGAIYSSREGRIFGNSRKSSNVLVPSELVIYEPKYLIKFSKVLGRSVYMWKEVAP